jgi:hypothetical protein
MKAGQPEQSNLAGREGREMVYPVPPLQSELNQDNGNAEPTSQSATSQGDGNTERVLVNVTPRPRSFTNEGASIVSLLGSAINAFLLAAEIFHINHATTLIHCANNGHEGMVSNELHNYKHDAANHYSYAWLSIVLTAATAISFAALIRANNANPSAGKQQATKAVRVTLAANIAMLAFFLASYIGLLRFCNLADCPPASDTAAVKGLGIGATAVSAIGILGEAATTALSTNAFIKVEAVKKEARDLEAAPEAATERTRLLSPTGGR